MKIGDHLPEATFSRIGEMGPEMVSLASLSKGKKLVLFGLPGAFTRTCTAAHLPSFIRTADAFREKGVDHIVCLSVNDPFVMKAWDKDMGAAEAGVELLADGDASFTKAIGMDFSAPKVGFIDRSKRYSAYIEDGVVTIFNPEPPEGGCDISAGETLLEQI